MDFIYDLGLKGRIARQTLARWRDFWRDRLSSAHPFLKWAQGVVRPGTVVTDRPASIVTQFNFPARGSWIPILKFFTHAI